ncbi:MAG: hypothetical protein ACYCZ2_15555 [Lutibacter sp.]
MEIPNYRSTVFFNLFRNRDFNEFDIYLELKKLTVDFDKKLLTSLGKELDSYLKIEKEKMEQSFTKEQIDAEVKSLEENELPVPKKGSLSGSTKKDTGGERNDGEALHKEITEALMYPDEFKSLYKLQGIIKERLESFKYEISTKILDEKKRNETILDPFTSYRAFEMFIHLLKGAVDLNKVPISETELSKELRRISYTYRKMYDDKFIKNDYKDTPFRDWLKNHFKLDIYQTKTLIESHTKDRENNYETSLLLFKLK